MAHTGKSPGGWTVLTVTCDTQSHPFEVLQLALSKEELGKGLQRQGQGKLGVDLIQHAI